MQTLEESLAEMTEANDKLKKENQELKEKILVLETEVIFFNSLKLKQQLFQMVLFFSQNRNK